MENNFNTKYYLAFYILYFKTKIFANLLKISQRPLETSEGHMLVRHNLYLMSNLIIYRFE